MTKLVIEKLTVKPARMVCDVRVEGLEGAISQGSPHVSPSGEKLSAAENRIGGLTGVLSACVKKPRRDCRGEDEPGACAAATVPGAQTSPGLIHALLGHFPTLLSHACVNDEGDTFAAVADHTSLPHLLEHLVIAMQVEAEIASGVPAVSSCTYVGTTEWTDCAQAKARVEVNYRDDLVALRSFSEAVTLINQLMKDEKDDSKSCNN